MSYVTPIFDRTLADITNKTSKAYFNVADWVRVNGNAEYIKELIESFLGISIQLDTVSTPTTATIPTVTDLNTLLANIEHLRTVSEVIQTTAIKHDWVAGIGEKAPDYLDVNKWEQTIDVICHVYSNYDDYALRFPRTGIAKSGVGRTRNNKFR
jgi:hypothetical protein